MTSPSGTSQRRRVAVLLNHSLDPEVWRDLHQAGKTIDVTPYGYELAEKWFDMTWARSHIESTRIRRLRISLSGRLGFDLVHAWRNRRTLFESDVVWTHTEREHLAAALVLKLVPRSRRPRLLAQSIWLWDRWGTLSRPRRRLYAWLLREAAVEATHSPLNLAVSRLAVPGRRVIFVPFGTKGLADMIPAAAEDAARRWDVVAPGNDEHRDWATLAEVARARPAVNFWVASSSRTAHAQAWSPNVRVEEVIDMGAYAALLAGAGVCVLPLKPNVHASGMTTHVEATSVRTPVIVAGDGGLRTVFGSTGRYVDSGDVDALSVAIDTVLDEQRSSGRGAVPDLVARGLRQRDYVTRYALVTDMMCGDRPWSDEASTLTAQERQSE